MMRDEILAMEPGNELDLLVANKIFGRKEDPHRHGWIQVGNLSHYPKRYSTNISAAWEVVEKMKQTECEIRISIYKGLDRVILYNEVGDLKESFRAQRLDIPATVCRCALLAVMGQEAS